MDIEYENAGSPEGRLSNPDLIDLVISAAAEGGWMEPPSEPSLCLIFNTLDLQDHDGPKLVHATIEAFLDITRTTGLVSGGSALGGRNCTGLCITLDIDPEPNKLWASLVSVDEGVQTLLKTAGVSSFRIGEYGGEFTGDGFRSYAPANPRKSDGPKPGV